MRTMYTLLYFDIYANIKAYIEHPRICLTLVLVVKTFKDQWLFQLFAAPKREANFSFYRYISLRLDS